MSPPPPEGDRLVVSFPEPLGQLDRRRVLRTVFELMAEDYVDELGWNAEFTEFRVVAPAPISEFPDDRLDDLARRVELAVPLPEGAVQVRRIASGV